MIKLKVRVVDVSGAKRYAENLAKRQASGMCYRIMVRSVGTCPVGNRASGGRSGPRMRDCHKMNVTVAGTRVQGQVYNTAPYAQMVHNGTRAHTISARRPGGFLRFTIAGITYFRRSVRHPGSRPNPWMRKAAQTEAAAAGWSYQG